MNYHKKSASYLANQILYLGTRQLEHKTSNGFPHSVVEIITTLNPITLKFLQKFMKITTHLLNVYKNTVEPSFFKHHFIFFSSFPMNSIIMNCRNQAGTSSDDDEIPFLPSLLPSVLFCCNCSIISNAPCLTFNSFTQRQSLFFVISLKRKVMMDKAINKQILWQVTIIGEYEARASLSRLIVPKKLV